MQAGLVYERPNITLDPQTCAGRVQVRLSWRQQPIFQLPHKLLFLLGLFDFRETFEIGVRQQFGGQRTAGPQEEEGGLLQPRFALGGHQTRPPFLAGEILARK